MFLALYLTSCGGGSDKSDFKLDYLAVQIEKGDNWSIMDANGKILVKEEYSPEDEISVVSPEGVYWVKSGIDGKFRLYSIDSPKQPIISDEYAYVTIFMDGRSFVSDGENPIQVIDTKGKVRNTLSKEIRAVMSFENIMSDRIAYVNKNGDCGYLDMDGDIVVEAQYYQVYPFSDGVALVENADENKLHIIANNGKEKGTIDLDRYEVANFLPIYKEGKLAVTEKANHNRLLYLGKNGEKVLEFPKNYERSGLYSNFYGGYAIVEDNEGNSGVINEDGEVVIRVGKYDKILNLRNGTFIVGYSGSKDKYGIVDSEDEIIIENNYNGALVYMFGDNYVMHDNADYLLVKPNGDEIKNSQFQNVSADWYKQVVFHNVQQIAADLVAQIETKGYTPILGKQNVKDIANALNQKVEDQSHGKKYMDIPSFKADVYDVKVSLGFNERTLYEKTHREVVNDGWFSHEKTVSDGWSWNENAMLENVYLIIDELHEEINVERLSEEIFKALGKKGFEYAADGYYEAKNGDKFAGVEVSPGYKKISVIFYPYKKYSENQFE